IQLPPAASLQRTDEVCKKVEKILAETKGVEYGTDIVGFSLLTRVTATYNGFFFVSLKPWSEREDKDLEAHAILRTLNGRLSREIPEANAFAFSPPAIPGLGNAGGFSFWLQDRAGRDVDFL